MEDFQSTVQTIKRLQNKAHGDPELVAFVVLLARLYAREPDDVLNEFQSADPIDLANKYFASLNEDQGKEAIAAARRGDYSLIGPRINAKLITPAEKRFLENLVIFNKTPKGRPPTMQTRHRRIAVSIEAFRGAGLTLRAAKVRASQAWCLSEDTIEEIYKNHKLPEAQWKHVREHFLGSTEQQVLDAVRDFREQEKEERD